MCVSPFVDCIKAAKNHQSMLPDLDWDWGRSGLILISALSKENPTTR